MSVAVVERRSIRYTRPAIFLLTALKDPVLTPVVVMVIPSCGRILCILIRYACALHSYDCNTACSLSNLCNNRMCAKSPTYIVSISVIASLHGPTSLPLQAVYWTARTPYIRMRKTHTLSHLIGYVDGVKGYRSAAVTLKV